MNSAVFPIIVPLFFAIILIFAPNNRPYQKIVAALGIVATFCMSFFVLQKVHIEGAQVVTFGSWQAPFGITMVADSVSALFVTAASLVTLFIVAYSFVTIDRGREQNYYYAIVLLMLVGVNGAFTTGDLFNLFVFFEVFLMASYLLSVIGGTKKQLKESLKYMFVNVFASALFVIGVAMLYAVIGTLNMADISTRVMELGQPPIVTAISVVLLIVFAFKAALFPFFFWLPSAYSVPPIPIIALFGALLTKVGVYSILRTYTLLFPLDTSFTHTLLMILGIATMIVGCIGALASWNVIKIVIYNIFIAVGLLIYSMSVFNEESFEGMLYYTIHDMFIKAALFLLVGILIYVTGTQQLRQMGGVLKRYPVFAWTFFIAILSIAGIPPFSGFIGKMLIVKGSFAEGHITASIWVLFSSLLVLWSMIRIFIYAFWGKAGRFEPIVKPTYVRMLIPTLTLVAICVAYGVFSGFVFPYVQDGAKLLMDPTLYSQFVLKGAN